jgi:hypothetical protein
MNQLKEPFETKMSFDFVNGGEYTLDGFPVTLDRPTPGTQGVVTLEIEQAAGGWWKAITIFRNDGFQRELCAIYDSVTYSGSTIEKAQTISRPGYKDQYLLVFSFAKAFGIHTNIYLIDKPGRLGGGKGLQVSLSQQVTRKKEIKCKIKDRQ